MAQAITELAAELRRVELHVPFKVAYGTTEIAELTIVQLRDADGLVGIGEGAPPSYLSTAEKERATSVALKLAEHCRGLTPDAALDQLNHLRPDVFDHTPIAFVAVETALWDLRGRQQRKSLCDQLGGAKRRTISTDITFPLIGKDEVAPFWSIMGGHDFRVLKLKVSGNIGEDVGRIEEILRVTPPGLQIFVDGNQGFDVDRCLHLINELQRIGAPRPLFFEQPLPKDAWSDLKRLSEICPIPVCLDETISTVSDIERCIRDRVAPMLNLKIMKSGLDETIQIARLASAARMPMMIGGMVESEITMTASLHLMCAMPAIEFADLDTPFFLKERLCVQSAWHRANAQLVLNDGYGLGLELKQSVR
jgi:L-alanine-DL-glutamate epimerase-like enolase superfamily enzyme